MALATGSGLAATPAASAVPLTCHLTVISRTMLSENKSRHNLSIMVRPRLERGKPDKDDEHRAVGKEWPQADRSSFRRSASGWEDWKSCWTYGRVSSKMERDGTPMRCRAGWTFWKHGGRGEC